MAAGGCGRSRTAGTIVGHALTNALEHTNPARTQVTVRYATEALRLEIRDDRGTTVATYSDTNLRAVRRERAAPSFGSSR